MKNISIDKFRCEKSNDMSFNQKSYGFATENRFFPVKSCLSARNNGIKTSTK
jgi:hypothetical protein